jgi:putative endonuclease
MRVEAEGWWVYFLRCADGTLYCGITNDIPRRLVAHGRGRVKYTRGRLPVEVAHAEPARDRSAALRKEAAWKRLSRREKLALIGKGGVRGATCLSSAVTVSPEDAEALPALAARRRGRKRLR